MAKTEHDNQVKTNIDVPEPPLFRVIYINDELTPIQFVIQSLVENFDYTTAIAEQTALQIHEQGSAVVAVLPYEIAEQKGMEITIQARTDGYPLQIKLEPHN